MMNNLMITIDNKQVSFSDERNLLEVIRKANIDLPTFCYHSEMSIYGACRLCMVEIEGRGLQPACSTLPEAGMVVRTNTGEVRELRKMIIELLLASHEVDCPSCEKGSDCQLQSLAQRLGVKKVRFKNSYIDRPVDDSSPAIIRDPNKCILCGDCVRACNEIQHVGAIDFAFRGAESTVMPCFDKKLSQVECVYCGQCVRVCPTGALLPKTEIDKVWKDLHNKNKVVIAQIAPAVRIALGESFGLEPGTITTGKIVRALRRMGFDYVYDTSFGADLTILEEANEFIERFKNNEKLPQFTSCCPGWVKYAEQYYPEYLPNLSTCKSPQQMVGVVSKNDLINNHKNDKDNVVMVSIMPCTAKKFEAKRPEFESELGKDIDHVITTIELSTMIKEMGLDFNSLDQDSFDLPFGFKTGGGVIFGNSGGVTEAVLRFASEKLTGKRTDNYVFKTVRGTEGLREANIAVGDKTLRLAIVSGLGNAHKLVEQIKSGEKDYDFVEVMACPGGCINGGGQPTSHCTQTKEKRTAGLYDNDTMLQLHKSQENPYITEVYENLLQKPGSDVAHKLLHTHYQPRKRIQTDDVSISKELNATEKQLTVSICFGTSCFIRGAQNILQAVTEHLKITGKEKYVDIKATFCYEKCERGPVVKIGDELITHCTVEKAIEVIDSKL
nr:NADH-dependent [FeFe] hydrogenase, group A6 [Clostridium sp. 'deep sea']